MRLPRLDVIFGLASPTVDILVKDTGVAELQVRDDEARVWPYRADFDARDDPLDAAPARSSVEKLLEAAELAVLGRSLKARLGASATFAASCRWRFFPRRSSRPLPTVPVPPV